MEQTVGPSDPPDILVVDDEIDLLEMFARRLIKAGFAVSTASTGSEAIGAMEKKQFKVVICDINMPGGASGFDVFTHARRRTSPKVGFIFVTGHGEGTPEMERALSLGVDGVYSKPISSKTLIAQLRQLCGLPSESP